MPIIYIPSCKFTAYSPEASNIIKKYLAENYGVEIIGCCRENHKKIKAEDLVVYICNTCGAFSRESSSAQKGISIWELLENDENFLFPDYGQRKMAVQDCWRVYDNEPQQQAVRRILQKMNIKVEELAENFAKTKFCGTTLYEPLPKQNGELAPERFITNAGSFFQPHPKEEQEQLMKDHCQQIKSEEVVCYCVPCIKGINLGGQKGIHLLDLMLGLADIEK